MTDFIDAFTNVVIMVDDYSKQGMHNGDIVKVIERHEEGEGKQTKYFYDLLINAVNGTILNKVPRSHFTPFTRKDSCIIKDILLYRESYADVVEDLNELFSNITFCD